MTFKMPVFVENPVLFSKQRLKSELISHNVELPSSDSDKQVYVELYKKHVQNKSTTDFSSDDDDDDDDDQVHNGNEEEARDETDMIDLSLLTDDQLKHKLLQHGIKPGPIVGSTRALYERKLHRLMIQRPQQSVNNATSGEMYSDSEEEEEDEEESSSKPLGLDRVSNTETTHSTEPVTDVMIDLFPDAAFTPTGIIATKRRSIKGAAGRPVQFKYPETPLTPSSQEQREMQKCLVPLWLQIGVFLLIATILYFMYILLEQPLDNPFNLLLDSQEPISDELISNTHAEDTNT